MIKYEFTDTGLTIADRTQDFIADKSKKLEEYIKGDATLTIMAKKEGNIIEMRAKFASNLGIHISEAENKGGIELSELFATEVFPKLKTQVQKSAQKLKKIQTATGRNTPKLKIEKEKVILSKNPEVKIDINSVEGKNLTKQLERELRTIKATTKAKAKPKVAVKRAAAKDKAVAKKKLTTQRRAEAKK